jgi:hypothetical protein
VIPRVSCDPVTTGTYVKTTTYPCELQIEEKIRAGVSTHGYYGSIGSFIQVEKDVIFAEVQRQYDTDFGSYAKCWVGLFNSDGQFIRWLDDYHNRGANLNCSSKKLDNLFVQQSKTEIPYIYYVVTSGERYSGTAGSKGLDRGLHVIKGTGTFPDFHSYKTDIWGAGKIYLNEDKNELYYFMGGGSKDSYYAIGRAVFEATGGGSLIYQINGMGEIKSTPTPTAVVSEPVSEPEPEPIQKASRECSGGYTFVDGMCTQKIDVEKKLGDKVYFNFDEWSKDIPNMSVRMKLIDPSGQIVQDKTTSGNNRLSIEYPEAGMVGDYETITEIYFGDNLSSTSRIIVSVVGEEQQTQQSKGGGCLIATAAFGSEMAPQVQFLRELRDNTVLQTESGTSFMTGFNQFYYSFSPYIADYERENPAFKETVKLALTPLLTSLTLLQYVDIDSESEMLGYGIGVILLNIGMYFVAPAVLIMAVRKRI